MLHRPNPNEAEEDLIQLDKEFRSGSTEGLSPAAKVVRVGKRKTEELATPISLGVEGAKPENAANQRSKSKFAESHSKKKKKKEGLVDNTILNEAVIHQKQSAVLGQVVERNVPALMPFIENWKPAPSAHGFPKAPKLSISENLSTNTTYASPKKSLYLQQLEKDSLLLPGVNYVAKESERTVKASSEVDDNLLLLGNKSYVLDGKSGLGNIDEAKRIHEENLSKLAEMTHEERLRERNEMMTQLTNEQTQFIQSLRLRKNIKDKIVQDTLPQVDKNFISKSDVEELKNENMNLKSSNEAMEVDVDSSNASCSKNIMTDTNLKFSVDREQQISKGKRTVTFKNEMEDEEIMNDEQSTLNLPISPREAKKWVHMNKVELDKLRWMTEVPQPKPLKNNEGFIARFSFEGDLLPYESEVTWHEGLHHHGDEPARAGYTLDELFIFVRSQVVQQRHIGLKTIANIIRNAKEGLYDTCLEIPVIQLMVDAGIVLLLRFAIDESTALVYQEALRALYFLVSSEPDENCILLSEPWSPDGVQPGISSLTHATDKDREELDAEEKELKDVEVIKLDVIRALVRMDSHIRLRYFLESVTLSAPDVIHILGILKRIARHSLTAAWTLVNTPRLLSTIVHQFLPHNISPLLTGQNLNQITSVYGVPLRHALSFFKVLAGRGRQIAALLIGVHDMMSRILAYISMEPTIVQMPLAEVLLLSQEAYSLWSLFLAYGLMKAQQSFSSIYPLIVKQLVFYRDKVDINENIEANQYNYDVGAHLANVISKGLCIAATKSLLMSRMKKGIPSVTSNDGKEQVLPPPELEWQEFEEILTLVEICVSKWISQISRNSNTSFLALKLIGSFCRIVTIYFEKWRDQPSFEGVILTKKIENIYFKVIVPLLTSDSFIKILSKIQVYSAILSKLKLGTKRDPRNLGSLACVCEGGIVSPIVQKGSPYPFLLPFVSLLKCIFSLHPTLDSKAILTLLNSDVLKKYFGEICLLPHSLREQWLTRIEVFLVADILELASIIPCDNALLCHKVGLSILPLIHKGDEYIVKSLLTNVICNPDFVGDLSEVETQIHSLTMKAYKPLKSPALSQSTLSVSELTKRITSALPSIGQDLVKNVLHSSMLHSSLVRKNCVPFMTNRLVIDDEEFPNILDHYWCLTPITLLSGLNETKDSDQTSPEMVLSVTRWIQMAYFILKYRQDVTYLHTNATGWFRHLSMIFLASSDLFLDVHISSYVQACLMDTLQKGKYNLDWTLTFPNLQFCYDWYKRMLQQFESVSYGDSTFALFIIIPLQRYWPQSYRALLFGEHADVLPFIRLTTDEVSQFIPLEQFLNPPEDDELVITKYRLAISARQVSESRSPFLFKICTHHVTQFLKIIKEKKKHN